MSRYGLTPRLAECVQVAQELTRETGRAPSYRAALGTAPSTENIARMARALLERGWLAPPAKGGRLALVLQPGAPSLIDYDVELTAAGRAGDAA